MEQKQDLYAHRDNIHFEFKFSEILHTIADNFHKKHRIYKGNREQLKCEKSNWTRTSISFETY